MIAKRSFVEIVHDILQMDGKKKTHIVYGTGLTHPQAMRYLVFLIERGLVEKGVDAAGRDVYGPTEAGRRLNEHLDVVMEYLGLDGIRA